MNNLEHYTMHLKHANLSFQIAKDCEEHSLDIFTPVSYKRVTLNVKNGVFVLPVLEKLGVLLDALQNTPSYVLSFFFREVKYLVMDSTYIGGNNNFDPYTNKIVVIIAKHTKTLILYDTGHLTTVKQIKWCLRKKSVTRLIVDYANVDSFCKDDAMLEKLVLVCDLDWIYNAIIRNIMIKNRKRSKWAILRVQAQIPKETNWPETLFWFVLMALCIVIFVLVEKIIAVFLNKTSLFY